MITTVNSIIEHAQNLEKLDVSFTRIGLFDYTKFLAVKSMPKLKVLCCQQYGQEAYQTENIRKQLPNISINPTKKSRKDIETEAANIFQKEFWDIEVKDSELFPNNLASQTYLKLMQ